MISVCVSVCTDMVLLYNIAFYRSWEGLKLFWERLPAPHSQDKLQAYGQIQLYSGC